MKDKRGAKGCIFLFFIILITAFILSNSFENYENSHSSSETITDLIVSSDDNDHESIEPQIRKIAHVVEFALLGTLVIAFARHLHQRYRAPAYGFAFFYVLAIAVADEHIQSFSNRTSSTGDIILDFCGALIGFLVGWLIIKVCVMKCYTINKADKHPKSGE